MDIRTISIEEIGLSVRSLNALRRAEVLTVGDMLQHTEESLMQIRNLGRKSVQEILEKIAEYTQYLEAGIVPPGLEEQPSNAIIPEDTEKQPNILSSNKFSILNCHNGTDVMRYRVELVKK